MTDLDDSLIPRIAEIVEAYGKDLTFYNNAGTGTTYDPDTGGVTGPASDTYTIRTTPPTYVRKLVEGTMTLTGECEVLVPASGLDATFLSTYFDRRGRVDFDSKGWTIVEIEPIYTGASIGAYRVLLKPRGGSGP